MALMSSGGGLSNGKLGLATATSEDVISGKLSTLVTLIA